MADEIRYTVKAVGDWELDVLGLPYGGPFDGKDADGEWFDAETQTHEDRFPLPPAVYAHGRGQDRPAYIGRTLRRWRDEAGEWFRVVLDKGHELAKAVMDAAREGRAAASSGTAGHLVRKTPDGRILEWPVLELSIFDVNEERRPANPWAIVRPIAALKAIYADAGMELPDEVNANAEPDAGPPAATECAGAIETETTKGDSPMEDKDIKAIVAETVKAMQQEDELAEVKAAYDEAKTELAALKADVEKIKAEPPRAEGGTVKVSKDPADELFKTLAEQCFAVKTATLGGRVDSRLRRLKAVDFEDEEKQTGANEGQPAAGGFLLEPTLISEFLKPLHEDGPFTRLARKMPVGPNSNYGWINGVDETSRATGSRWGGIRGYWVAEGGLKTASRPTFRRINWELKEAAVLVYATDALLQDAPMFSEVVRQGASEELSFMVNDAVLTGAGANGPLGILAAGCLITQPAEAGQLADTVVTENIDNMWQRLLPRSKPRSAWFINSEVEPQLDNLAIAVGASALEPRFVTYDAQGAIRMKGRPVYVTEFNSALGDLGDVVLADMSEYLLWEKGGVQSAQSIHVHFIYDETVFRFIYRCDGQPTYATAITPYRATAGQTQSPFVTLEAR